MSVEVVMRALLNVSGITSIVGANLAMIKLPQGAGYPALVWEPVSEVPEPPIDAEALGQMTRSRVQVTALARTAAAVVSLHAAVRSALEFSSGSIAGVQVVAVTREFAGPYDNDETAKVFSRPVDYMVLHYDPTV